MDEGSFGWREKKKKKVQVSSKNRTTRKSQGRSIIIVTDLTRVLSGGCRVRAKKRRGRDDIEWGQKKGGVQSRMSKKHLRFAGPIGSKSNIEEGAL